MEKESRAGSDNAKDNNSPNNVNDQKNQINYNALLDPFSINPFINPNLPINNTPLFILILILLLI